jgi:galactose oxidase-like protein/Kelch motif protein
MGRFGGVSEQGPNPIVESMSFRGHYAVRALRTSLVTLLVAAILAVVPGAIGTAWAAPSSPYFASLPAAGASELQTARFGASAATLPDGHVLIAGGHDGTNYLKSAELFNPITDTFSELLAAGETELHTGREAALAVALPNGQVLIAGGYNEGSGDLQSAELFNPANDTFTALTAAGETELQMPRYGAFATLLADGRVLIGGGYDEHSSSYLQSTELFNPATGTFAALNAELHTPRFDASAARLPDGQVLIAGGQNSSGALSSAELFNPADNTFTALSESGATELQRPRLGAATTLLPGGRVLIVGGFNGINDLQSAELFDPAGNTFTLLPEAGETELRNIRGGAIAAILPDGRALIAGGIGAGASYLQSAELFYSAPQVAAVGGSFGDQTVSESSPATGLVITNVGAQELAIAGATLEGANAADFAIAADTCSGRRLAFAQSCTITARFTPATTGALAASIALSDNEPSATDIALSGTGVAANSGPTGPAGPAGPAGSTGPTGTGGGAGASGAAGSQGPAGTEGPAGPQGAAGQIELVSCKPVTTGSGKRKKTVQKCTAKLTSSPVKFTAAAASAVVLARGKVIYATGSAERLRGRTNLLLSTRRRIEPGVYTLALTRGGKQQLETITVSRGGGV